MFWIFDQEEVQKALREAVNRGDGLLVAGSHDERNHGIGEALGIKVKGKHSKAVGVTLPVSELMPLVSDITFPYEDKELRIELKGATAMGDYVFSANSSPASSQSNHDDDNGHNDDDEDHKSGKKGKGKDDDDDDHNDEDNSLLTTAVTLNNYGQGKAVFAGFDLLAYATALGEPNDLATLLVNALEAVHPAELTPIAGGVVPVILTLTNQGIATPGQVIITLPVGSEVIEAEGTTALPDSTLVWPFNLAIGESQSLTVWLRLPNTGSSADITAVIQTGITPDFIDHDTASLTITYDAMVSLAAVITSADDLTTQGLVDKQVGKNLSKAQHELDEGDIEDALEKLLKATDYLLDNIAPEAVALRRDIDFIIKQLARDCGAGCDE